MTDPCLVIDGREEPIALGGETLLGRSAEADIAFPDDMTCSRRQAIITVDDRGVIIHPLSENVPVLVNGTPLGGPVAVEPGSEITFGAQRMTLRDSASAMRGPAAAPPDATVFAGGRSAANAPQEHADDIALHDRLIIGRAGSGADVELDHPTVSRRHSQISLSNGVAIRDLGSTNGTFVNGARVGGAQQLSSGDRVEIGPFSFVLEGLRLKSRGRTGAAALYASGLSLEVASGSSRLRILDDVSVEIQPKEFVCIVGPSGSGKTTLMKILAGRATPTGGAVTLNDVDLRTNFQSLKQDMAMVPQHDVLHENLKLRRALNYTAMLRLPEDTSAAVRAQAVERAAADVDLQHRLDTRIGNLSGGQKKRASLASETLSGPSLLFLDEVTSGLDEATDREIMRLLRRKADNGMTVICVTHTLANVEEFCHKLIVMGEGGVLSFVGPPQDAFRHFGVSRLGEIFDRLQEQPATYWRAQLGPSQSFSATGAGGPQSESAKPRVSPATLLRQFSILTRRNIDLLLADRRALIMAAAQSILIGVLIGYAFNDFGPPPQVEITSKNALLLLLGLCAIWLGCNSASQDIVGELPIFRRENDVNLSAGAFVVSKFVVSGAFTMLQLAVVFGLVAMFADSVPGEPIAQLTLLLIGALAGTSIGLLISSLADTNEQATTIVPLALVPQLILAGVLVPKLPEFATAIAKVGVSGFWLTEGMKSNLIEAEGPIEIFDPMANAIVAMEAEPALAGGIIIGVHSLFFLFLAYLFVLLGARKRD